MSANKDDPSGAASEDPLAKLAELFRGLPPAQRHFRYPVDGPSDIKKAIDRAIEEVFGPEPPDSPYRQWVAKLRRNGLIR